MADLKRGDPVFFLNPRAWQVVTDPNRFKHPEAQMNPRDLEQIECLKAEQARIYNQKNADAQCGSALKGCDTPAREITSRELLAELCMRQQIEADELNDLLKALPQELPYRADRALRRLIQQTQK